MTARAWSDLTVTDVFCGAGGNTIGAKKAGLRVRVGLNHWERAIETYGTNNPEVDVVERVDVSLCDPRRYPSTDIAVMSPECTTHSPAGGNRHHRGGQQPSLFGAPQLDPATVRSRVTMFDVVRFTEYHRYRIVIAENVVEATRWELFPDWLHMMTRLGYAHRILSLNSMFFHPTPQSRDRIYVVFWQKGNRAPNLDFRPAAPCARCGVVAAVQAWKPGRTIGKYRWQYRYACPRCAREVTPFYYAALNALDFSLAAERIGDRKRPLKARTMERIAFGLEKYGRRALVVQTNMTSGVECRVRQADGDPMPTQAASAHHGFVAPAAFLVGTSHGGGRGQAASAADPAPTQTTAQDVGVCAAPGFLVALANGGGDERRALGVDEPMRTIHAGGNNHALIQPTSALVSPFVVSAGSRDTVAAGTDPMPTQTASERLAMVVPLRNHAAARPVSEALPTVAAAGQHHMLVQGAAQISMRDADAMRVAGLDRELMTQGCGPQQAVIARAPFLVSYYGSEQATPSDGPVPAITTLDRHGVVDAAEELRVEDCFFRMLQPHEIGAAMAFPGDYVVGGNKRDRVKQYGNAVTPPVMDWIVRQCAATLAPELEEGAA